MPKHLHKITVKQLLQALECASIQDSSTVLAHQPITVDQSRFNECVVAITSIRYRMSFSNSKTDVVLLSIVLVYRKQEIAKAYSE